MQKDELSFNKNDLIMLISRIGDGQWLRGRNMQGQEGIFPSSFVEIVVMSAIYEHYYSFNPSPPIGGPPP